MAYIKSLLDQIKKAGDELQEMVLEKDCMDDEVLEKTREFETLQKDYYSFLRLMNRQD